MGDIFYRTIKGLCRVPFVTSGRPVVMGVEQVPRAGPLLMASNHISWYDIPLLAVHSRRLLDFLAIYKLYERPAAHWFFENMNGIRYDSSKPDTRAVRAMLTRLKRGRCVVIFPEGKLCRYEDSLFTGRPLYPGMARLALAAQAPVLPVVLANTDVYRRFKAWLPVCGARYGMIFGAPIPPPARASAASLFSEVARFEEQYRAEMSALRATLLAAMQVAGASTRFEPVGTDMEVKER